MAASLHFDTNCLLRLALQDLPEQASRVEEILKLNSVVHVADAAVIEMVFVLEKRYDLERMLIAQKISFLINTVKIDCSKELLARTIKDYVKSPKTSFADVYLAHYANLHSAKLLTFDKTLAKKLSNLVKLARDD
jgi:predicted nucleic-acid-binding protein